MLVSGTKVSNLNSSSFLLNSFLLASFGSFITPYSQYTVTKALEGGWKKEARRKKFRRKELGKELSF